MEKKVFKGRRTISDELVEKCRQEQKKQGKRGENGRRLQAIISAQEHGIEEVAKIYDISERTLRRWAKRYDKEGVQAFSVAKGRGPKSKLSHEQMLEINEYIQAEGKNATIKSVRLEIKKRFDIDLSRSSTHRFLRKQGFSHITPRPIHHKKDPEQTKEFIENTKKKIKEKPKYGLYFFDEARFGMQSTTGYGWFRKGSRTRVKVKQEFKNFYLYSSVSPKSGDEFTLLMPTVNTDWMNKYLEEFSKELGDKKAFLIIDNAGWHKSNELKVPKNIEIIYLPPYSPELNPVERLWQYIKDNILKNRIYEKIKDLEDTACSFVNSITSSVIQSVCNVKYLGH